MYVNTLAKDMLAKTLSSESQLGNKNIFTCVSSISDMVFTNTEAPRPWSDQHRGRSKFIDYKQGMIVLEVK